MLPEQYFIRAWVLRNARNRSLSPSEKDHGIVRKLSSRIQWKGADARQLQREDKLDADHDGSGIWVMSLST